MGLFKQALCGCIFIIIVTCIYRYFESKLPVNIGGTWDPKFQKVVDVFRDHIESGKEPGAAFAVYYKGKKVIDVWGGYADVESLRPWEENTTTLAFSCTKGAAAILMAKMVEQGTLDYSKPVSYYWPEFAQEGKENITVEMLISHQGGLVCLDEPLSVFDYKKDREKWSQTLAKQKTVWPAGTKFGYHALTFGLYVDELIQHADPQHRQTADIFDEEISKPFGIDFHMNSPLHEFYRNARLYPRSRIRLLIDALNQRRYLRPMYDIVFRPDSLMARSVSAIKEMKQRTDVLNNPYIREVTVSSVSGTGTARGLARLYGIITNGGVTENGEQLLSKATVDRLSIPVVSGTDSVMTTGEISTIGLGTLYRKNPKGEMAVGHSGHGGQVAVGDIKNGLGISYLTNHLTIDGVGRDPRFRALEDKLYEVIESINIE